MTFKDDPNGKSKEEKKKIEEFRNSLQNEGTDIIRKGILNLSGDFNKWHEGVCNELITIYGDKILVKRDKKGRRTNENIKLTYGQAQKWLNMSLKYLWLLNRLGGIDDDNLIVTIEKYQDKFHVPLDSYILRYVSKQSRNKKDPFSSLNDNELSEQYSFREFWDCFGSAWSQITDAKKYFEYQEKLMKAVGEKPPLEWELIHWRKALKYYG